MEEGKICKLQRYIYGLNNAPREWYNRVEQELLKFREGGGGEKKSLRQSNVSLKQKRWSSLWNPCYTCR